MNDYIHFTVSDFVEDEWFRAWVLNHDEAARSFWQIWREEHPHRGKVLEEAEQILLTLKFPVHRLPEEDVSALWNQIKSSQHQNTTPFSPGILRRNKTWMVAAVLLLLAALPWLWLMQNEHLIYTTAFGETRTILLPDSSTVVLNANSQLSFTKDWEKQEAREVWMEGEAFFSIRHTLSDQPFYVKTKDGVAVEVLGTTFNVYHRTDDTRVFLNTGKIRLSLPDQLEKEKIIMKPGELVEYSPRKYNKRKVAPESAVGWTQRKLILDHTSLREMAQMLKDNYGLQVDVQPVELLDQTVSGSMPLADEHILTQQIGRAFGLHVTEKQDTVLFFE